MKTDSKTQKHTPGPWAYDDAWGLIKADDGSEIAAVHAARAFRAPRGQDAFKDEPKANARLIAAAPELLDCLIQLTRGTPDRHDYEAAEAAILRATEGR